MSVAGPPGVAGAPGAIPATGVVFSDEAESDLLTIVEHIRLHNPARAAGFLVSFLARCESFAETPIGYPLVPRYAASDVRRCMYQEYLIFYRCRNETIEIVHILRGTRDHETLLFSEAK